MSTERRGLSLLEALVVAGVLALSLTTGLLIYNRARRSDVSDGRSQELAQLLARLEIRLRADLRSATQVVEEAAGRRWRLQVMAMTAAGTVASETVLWQRDPRRDRVEREAGTRRDVYDFTGLLVGQPLVFSLTP